MVARAQPPGLETNASIAETPDLFPAVATDGEGVWMVAWQSKDPLGGAIGSDLDILFSRSENGGASWSEPKALNANAARDTGGDFNIQLAASDGGAWLALWLSTDSLGGKIGPDHDLLIARSSNGGRSWSQPRAIAIDAGEDDTRGGDFSPMLATDGAGVWLAAWEAFGALGADSDPLAWRSADGGATWPRAVLLRPSSAEDRAADFSPRVLALEKGRWLAMWWSDDPLGGGDMDILVSRSTDGGVNWSEAAALDPRAGSDRGEDRFPRVASDRAGRSIAVWESAGALGEDLDILFAVSGDSGATWSEGGPLEGDAAADTGDDRLPRIAAGAPGVWVVAWESSDPPGEARAVGSDVVFARSTDEGTTWSEPMPLHPGSPGDASANFNAELATDGRGNWLAVWETLTSEGKRLVRAVRSSDGAASWSVPMILGAGP